jgi:hypothetical protein
MILIEGVVRSPTSGGLLCACVLLLVVALTLAGPYGTVEAAIAPFTRTWQESDTWTLWPLPSQVSHGSASAPVGSLVFLNTSSSSASVSDLLDKAIARVHKNAFVFPTSAEVCLFGRASACGCDRCVGGGGHICVWLLVCCRCWCCSVYILFVRALCVECVRVHVYLSFRVRRS